MKFGRLALCFLALASLGWLDSASWADSHGKFPGKGSKADYENSCSLVREANKLAEQGLYEKAIGLLRQSISAYSTASARFHNLAFCLYRTGRFQQALEAENRALSLEPAFCEAWVKKGECLEQLGRLAEAENCYMRAFSLDQNSYQICFNLGDILLQQNKLSSARSYFEKARRQTKNPDGIAQVDERIHRLNGLREASH